MTVRQLRVAVVALAVALGCLSMCATEPRPGEPAADVCRPS